MTNPKANTKRRDEYWLAQDPEDAANYLVDFCATWSLWNMSPFRQAWLRRSLTPAIGTRH